MNLPSLLALSIHFRHSSTLSLTTLQYLHELRTRISHEALYIRAPIMAAQRSSFVKLCLWKNTSQCIYSQSLHHNRNTSRVRWAASRNNSQRTSGRRDYNDMARNKPDACGHIHPCIFDSVFPSSFL